MCDIVMYAVLHGRARYVRTRVTLHLQEISDIYTGPFVFHRFIRYRIPGIQYVYIYIYVRVYTIYLIVGSIHTSDSDRCPLHDGDLLGRAGGFLMYTR